MTHHGLHFPEAIRKLLVYHFAVLRHSVRHVLDNLFIPDESSYRSLLNVRERILRMTNEERGDYIDGIAARITMLEEGSEASVFLEELLTANRFIKLRYLPSSFTMSFTRRSQDSCHLYQPI